MPHTNILGLPELRGYPPRVIYLTPPPQGVIFNNRNAIACARDASAVLKRFYQCLQRPVAISLDTTGCGWWSKVNNPDTK